MVAAIESPQCFIHIVAGRKASREVGATRSNSHPSRSSLRLMSRLLVSIDSIQLALITVKRHPTKEVLDIS